MLPRRCILCCDTSITRLWHGQCVSSSALKAAKSWRAGFLNGSLRSGRISSSIGKTVWSACLPDGSRVRRESHARFCERPAVKFHRPTQPFGPHRYKKDGRWYLGQVRQRNRWHASRRRWENFGARQQGDLGGGAGPAESDSERLVGVL